MTSTFPRPFGQCKVVGDGCIKVKPDFARLVIIFDAQDERADVAQRMMAEKVKKFKTGVGKVTFVADERNLEPVKSNVLINDRMPAKTIGYLATATISIETEELDRVGVIVKQAVDSSATRFDTQEWGTRDLDNIKNKALGLAARNARDKAAIIAANNLYVLGVVIEIDEMTSHYYSGTSMRTMAYAVQESSSDGVGSSASVEPGLVVVRAKVEASYAFAKN